MSEIDSTAYKKLDLHIHTPRSLCYSDMTVTPAQIVEAAIVFGLDAIAVTDHNSADGIEGVRQAAAAENLAVFPGMELTTRSGHFLAVFDIGTPVSLMDGLLEDLGIRTALRGDAQYNTEPETRDVFRMVVERGGLVIAAHIERWPSGFLETKESRSAKMAIHADTNVSALEITVAQDREKWENGLVRGYPRKMACIQGSDAHSPGEVGRRPFFIAMDAPGLAPLRSAFVNWENAIAFPDELAD